MIIGTDLERLTLKLNAGGGGGGDGPDGSPGSTGGQSDASIAADPDTGNFGGMATGFGADGYGSIADGQPGIFGGGVFGGISGSDAVSSGTGEGTDAATAAANAGVAPAAASGMGAVMGGSMDGLSGSPSPAAEQSTFSQVMDFLASKMTPENTMMTLLSQVHPIMGLAPYIGEVLDSARDAIGGEPNPEGAAPPGPQGGGPGDIPAPPPATATPPPSAAEGLLNPGGAFTPPKITNNVNAILRGKYNGF